jgi:hypothetical protein
MKRILAGLLLTLVLAAPARAEEDFETAVALFENGRYGEARPIAETYAARGDARAMAMLGAMYQAGHGVEEDAKEAARWYTLAADKGHDGALFSLAMLLLDGSLGTVDRDRGLPLLQQSADRGNGAAQYNLGLIAASEDPPDWQKAASWFTRAAERGVAEAQYNLGVLYAEGRGVTKDIVTAGTWFARAASQGMPDAALDYGVMVYRGEGVQKDEKVGAQWLLVAARRGNVIAQNRVARILAAGRGMNADPVEAVKWHLLATAGGRGDVWLDEFMKQLTPAQLQDAQSRAASFEPEKFISGGG